MQHPRVRAAPAQHPVEGRHGLGRVPSDAVLAEAARAASADARPIDDLRASAGYRRAVLPVLVRRALEEALLQAQEAPA